MSELDFRAWNRKRKEMDYGSPSYIFDCYGMTPEDIMQSTGYIDKHGKKIFRGDIIYHCYHKATYQIVWGKFSDCCVEGETWVMQPDVWQPALGYWCYKDNTGVEFDEDDGVEIIGNVYKNPELIPQEVEA